MKTMIAGSLVLDILPVFRQSIEPERILAEGKVTESNGTTIYLGGEVGNTGLAMRNLGNDVCLVSKVGDDDVGDIVRGLLQRENVQSKLITMTGIPSTASIALAIPGRDKSTIHSRGASQTFVSGDFCEEMFEGVDWFHFGYPTSMKSLYMDDGKELVLLLKKIKGMGVRISVDMSLPDLNTDAGKVNWRSILKEALPYIDIFMPSIEEAIFLVMRERYAELVRKCKYRDMIDYIQEAFVVEIADQFLELGANAILLKCGKKGLFFKSTERCVPDEMWKKRELWCAPYKPNNVKSTTGAGDTAIAGFLTALNRGETPEKALNMAAFIAMSCVEAYDTLSGIKDYYEMGKKREAAKERLEGPAGDGWKYCSKSECYIGINDRKEQHNYVCIDEINCEACE